MLTGLWDLKDILNSRQNRSEKKLVRENAVEVARSRKLQDAKGNAKKVWNAVKEVCYRNYTSESVQCIISDGIQRTTPKSVASAMNSFFASIGKRLADIITTTWPCCNSSTDLPVSIPVG